MTFDVREILDELWGYLDILYKTIRDEDIIPPVSDEYDTWIDKDKVLRSRWWIIDQVHLCRSEINLWREYAIESGIVLEDE